ncbi:MAG: two-component system sensor histidine kinase CreC [Candidatus Polarisedimenticolia bacterium]
MRLAGALFLAWLAIFALCLSYPMAHLASTLQARYLEGIEEPLVDQANILAVLVGREMAEGRFDPAKLRGLFEEVYGRPLGARIYEVDKDRVDVRVYITDLKGMVLFDSLDPGNVGKDFSTWNDVRFTLEGRYGARTTLADPGDPASSVLHVAAPIRVDGQIAGVLTVAEPTTSVNAFLKSAKPGIFRTAAVWMLVAVSLSLLVSLWVSGQIGRLTRYADDVRHGKRVELPSLARTELKQMGDAFEKMRESLEGRKYVEQYVQTLTHELKSPVSAIRGAAELLQEEVPADRRAQFLSNIRHETTRIEDLVDQMLRLSELETRRSLEQVEPITLAAVVREVLEDKRTPASVKGLVVTAELEDGLIVKGDRFLLRQAVSNLVQNAVDFSPAGGRVVVRARRRDGGAEIEVEDAGPGIPDYAREKVFEKFYSLMRPDTGRKSTGLGLNFVKEVAILHKGEVSLENLPGSGLRALVRIAFR